MDPQKLRAACIDILRQNDRGTHVQPAKDLYPHQWLWDSCFIAIGLRHFDVKRAQLEIENLFCGQWANGMLPNMIFEPDAEFRRERNLWRSSASPLSPDLYATSGITQPPMVSEAIWLVGEKMPKNERIQWFKKLLPNLVRFHQWLYEDRDPHHEGLTLQIHPYETGLDSTPPWMMQLHEHSRPWWIGLIEHLHSDAIIHVLRRDTRHVPPEQRPSNIDALLMWDIIRRFRRKQWDIDRILHRSLFCIEDITFNSILVKGNQRLEQIAKACHIKLPDELQANMAKTPRALESCWDNETNQYYSRDFISHELIREPTIGGLIPLYAGSVSDTRREHLIKTLTDAHQFWVNHPVPSVPITSSHFNHVNYWQGPTWVNTNWLIIKGLRQLKQDQLADELTDKTLQMVWQAGPFEYFSPIDGTGLGSARFSWTAALIIDLLADH